MNKPIKSCLLKQPLISYTNYEKPFKYYSQPHELEAQIRGFEAKSKTTKTEIRKVMKDWFKKYPHKHNLKDKEVNKLIRKLLENYGKND